MGNHFPYENLPSTVSPSTIGVNIIIIVRLEKDLFYVHLIPPLKGCSSVVSFAHKDGAKVCAIKFKPNTISGATYELLLLRSYS